MKYMLPKSIRYSSFVYICYIIYASMDVYMYVGTCVCIQNWSCFLLQHAGPVPSKYQCAVCRFAICGEDSFSAKFQLSSWHDFESEQTCGIQGLPWSNSQVSMCTYYFKFILEIIWTLLYWIVALFVYFLYGGFV